MNGEIRHGLGVLCLAAMGGVVFLAVRPTEEPAFGESSLGADLAGIIGGLSVILALVGLLFIARALFSTSTEAGGGEDEPE